MNVHVATTRETLPLPHTGIPVARRSVNALKAVCSRVRFDGDQLPTGCDLPDGTLIRAMSMLQVGHDYLPMIMIGGYLQFAPTGIAQPMAPAANVVSEPHTTNLDKAIHHQPTYHHTAIVLDSSNRETFFGPGGAGVGILQQIGYAASSAAPGPLDAPSSGWKLKVEYVHLTVEVFTPDH